MGTLAPVIGSLGFLALLVGIVMFLPLAAFKARRPLAKKLAIGGGVAFVAALILDPNPPGDKVAAKVDPKPSPTAAAPSAPIASPQSSADGKERFVVLYRGVLSATKPCDAAVGRLGKVASSGDQYATYQVAKDGRDACRDTSTTIAGLDTPDGLTADAEAAVEKAVGECRDAYALRQSAMETAMQIADGEGRPSLVSEMSDQLKAAQGGVLVCVAHLFQAGSAAGVDLKRLN